jgi:hypothetical protein
MGSAGDRRLGLRFGSETGDRSNTSAQLAASIANPLFRPLLPQRPGWQPEPSACRFAYDSRRTLSCQRRSQQADERGPQFVVPFGVQAAPDSGHAVQGFSTARTPAFRSLPSVRRANQTAALASAWVRTAVASDLRADRSSKATHRKTRSPRRCDPTLCVPTKVYFLLSFLSCNTPASSASAYAATYQTESPIN